MPVNPNQSVTDAPAADAGNPNTKNCDVWNQIAQQTNQHTLQPTDCAQQPAAIGQLHVQHKTPYVHKWTSSGVHTSGMQNPEFNTPALTTHGLNAPGFSTPGYNTPEIVPTVNADVHAKPRGNYIFNDQLFDIGRGAELIIASQRSAELGNLGSLGPVKGFGIGLGLALSDDVMDQTIFKGTPRRLPSTIGDVASGLIAFTPQPLSLKIGEILGVHAIGKVADKHF